MVRALIALGVLAALGLSACGGGSSTVATKPTVERAFERGSAAPCTPISPRQTIGVVRLASDTPEPRCIKLDPDQQLRMVNLSGAHGQKGRPARIRIGPYYARLAPGSGITFHEAVGSYLAPGDHGARVSLYAGGGVEVFVARSSGRGDASGVLASRDQPQRRKCPVALRPGPNAASHALSALRHEVPRLYRPPSFRIKGYSIPALFSLDPTAQADASISELHKAPFSPRLYRRKAAEACGATVATRSWLAVLDFPRAAMATLDPALAYLTRTRRGWKLWYQWDPNLGKPAFPGE